MAENILKVAANTPEQQNKVAANTPAPQSKAPESTPTQQNDDTVSMAYILEQLEKIRAELFNLQDVIKEISVFNNDADAEGNVAIIGAKLHAIIDVFNCREETIQKLISFYEKMYDDKINANKK